MSNVRKDIFFRLDHGAFAEPADVPVLLGFSKYDTDVSEECAYSFRSVLPSRMLDVSNVTEHDFKSLCDLFDASPLYRVQLIFALDRVLVLHDADKTTCDSVEKAFYPMVLPSPLAPKKHDYYNFQGGLFHPFLDQLKNAELVQILINCIGNPKFNKNAELSKELDFYSIISVNARQFLMFYDGFLMGGGVGYVDAAAVLRHAQRYGRKMDAGIDTYRQRGHDAALSMAFADAENIIEAWLCADQFQATQARMVDAVMRKYKGASSYEWIKYDVFSILEREAMKQVFAEAWLSHSEVNQAERLGGVSKCPHLKMALAHNAKDGVDDCIQQLLTQILTTAHLYEGSARKFAAEAARRNEEYRHLTASL